MPHTCCVVNCGNRSNCEKISFYRIPSVLNFQHKGKLNELSSERRQKWLDVIKREDFTFLNIKCARVCAKHFITGKPAELQDKLNPDWVPSVNMGYHTTSAEGRLERYEQKRKRIKVSSEEVSKEECSQLTLTKDDIHQSPDGAECSQWHATTTKTVQTDICIEELTQSFLSYISQ